MQVYVWVSEKYFPKLEVMEDEYLSCCLYKWKIWVDSDFFIAAVYLLLEMDFNKSGKDLIYLNHAKVFVACSFVLKFRTKYANND